MQASDPEVAGDDSTVAWDGIGVPPQLVKDFDRLVDAARRGDRDATHDLSLALAYCESAPRSLDAAISSAAYLARATGQREPDVRPQVDWYRRCVPLRATMSREQRLEVALLAAQEKLPYARERYLDLGYEDATRDEALPEELDLYRQHARRFLGELVAEGDLSGLSRMSTAYEKGMAFRRDPVKAAAYLQALVEVAAPEPALEHARRRLLRELTEDERAQAAALAAAIVTDFHCRDDHCRTPAARPH